MADDLSTSDQATILDTRQATVSPPPKFFTFKEIVAATIAILVILLFGILMWTTVRCVLYDPNCKNGIATLNILANVFGPVVGVILAFYFSTIIISRNI